MAVQFIRKRNSMKKILVLLCGVLFSVYGFAHSLEGKDLQAVNLALDARLYVNDYEELEEQLAYLEKVESQIAEMNGKISDEAKLVCKSVIISQKQTSISADELKKSEDKKQKDKKNQDPSKDELYQCYLEYEEYEKSHSNLSAQFKFHKLEAEFSTMAYLSTTKALKKMKEIIEGYKALADLEPDYSENLFTLASVYYSIPKVMGGDKEYATKCVLTGIENARNNYEKSSCYILYSQFLFEEKKYDESKKYMELGKAIDPENKAILKYEEMNKAGYSIFDERAYKKEKK